jgi:plasmid stability protein
MAQVLIRNVPEATVETFRQKAKLNGRSLEQELRELLERNRPFTPEERIAAVRRNLARFKEPTPTLSIDEIRDGLE